MLSASDKKVKVFLSSTSKDLGEFRAAAADAIVRRGMTPIMMEHFPAVSRDAVEECKAKVEEADVFIGIYADRYGYRPRGQHQSITELEYHWAEDRLIDRLIFVFDKPKATLPLDHPIYQHADHDPQMTKFRDYVGKQVIWKSFASPEELKDEVNRALEVWEKRPMSARWFRPLQDMPVWVRLLSAILLIVTVGVLISSLIRLFTAGQTALGAFSVVMGILATAIPLLGFFSKGAQRVLAGIAGIERIKSWMLTLLTQVLVLIVVLVGAPMLLRTTGNSLIQQALVDDDLNAARITLGNAATLDSDVTGALDAELQRGLAALNLQADNARIQQIARLFAEFAPNVLREVRAAEIEEAARSAGEAARSDAASWLQVLSHVDPDRAVGLAREFYNDALDSYVGAPPDLPLARNYLDAVLSMVPFLDTTFSREEISVAHYVRGLISQANDSSAALDEYRRAIEEDDTNLEARYALAVALLIQVENGGDPTQLNEAIAIARAGYQDYIPQEYCRGSQDLSDEGVLRESWNCFALMTTEAGARILRGAGEDTASSIRGLLERAVRLAQANDNFRSAGFFTAEAYYWLARTTQPDPNTPDGQALYCSIIQHLDRTKPRHVQWLTYANEQLGERRCLPN